jgi:hypothetical protein
MTLRIAIILAAVAIASVVAPAPAARLRHAEPMLIYYGGAGSGSLAARAAHLAQGFRGYALVVFGLAWREPALAAAVRADAGYTRFYGYSDVGSVTMAHVLARLRLLSRMRFSGVLLDDVGSGLSGNLAQLQHVVDFAHHVGLAVLLNAWDPRQILGLHLRRGEDAVLCENWVYSDGSWHEPRSAAVFAALRKLQAQGVRVAMGVTAKRSPVSPARIREPVLVTAYTEVGNYVAVSGPYYSAQTDNIFPAGSLKVILRAAVFP